MNQHQRSLAFPDIAINLLAVTVVAHQVEKIVLDLKCGAEKEPVAQKRFQVYRAATPDQRADANRVDSRQPAGFFQNHLQVVSVADLGLVVSAPSQLHLLTLRTLSGHPLGLLDAPARKSFANLTSMVEQRSEARHR